MASKIFEVGDVLPAGLIEISVTNHNNFAIKNNIEERGLKSDNNLFNFFTIVPIDDPEDPDLMYEYYIADIWFGHCYMYYNEHDEEEYDYGFSWSVVIDTSDWSLSKRTISSVKWSTYNYGSYFTWQEIQRYSITFEENGGTSVTDLTEQTALPNPLPIPTKSGYTFVNWYYDSAFTQIANAGDTIESNVTLYAKWDSLGDYVEVEGGVLLNVYSGSESNVIIPETYYDKAVVGIGADAFRNNTNIESITLPSSILAIGNNAFNGCSNLKRVRINAITPPTLGTTPFINNHEDLEIVVSIATLLSYKQSWTSYSSIIKSVYSTDLNEIRKEKLALKQLLMEKGLYDEGMDFSKYHIKLQEYLSRAYYVTKIKENPDGSQDVEFIPISGELQAYNGPTTIVEDQVIPCAGKYMEHDIIVEVFDEEEMNERLDAIIARLNDIVGV